MSGCSAEALCLEVRRPLKPGRAMAHRKTFSLDSGSGRPGWGNFSQRVDELWPARSSSSADSGMTSTVPASNLQDVEPVRSTVNRGLAGGSNHHNVRHPLTPSSSELEADMEELDSPSGSSLALSRSILAASGSSLVLSNSSLAPTGSSLVLSGSSMALTPSVGDRRITKRERNRMKNVRRRQRRRERWRQREMQDSMQSCNLSSSSDDDDDNNEDEECSSREDGCICAVCLDVYFCPYMCHPCNHVFCEPCLRTLAKNCPTNTPCPLCRTTITHVFFQKELNHTTRTFFPKEYLSRKQNFQKASCAKWPLPSCRKLFRIFGGFQRQGSPMARRQFPHGGYRLDTLDLEEDSQGWRFDMDMVIIYIYSVNWVIGFIIFIFLCYCFFPSL